MLRGGDEVVRGDCIGVLGSGARFLILRPVRRQVDTRGVEGIKEHCCGHMGGNNPGDAGGAIKETCGDSWNASPGVERAVHAAVEDSAARGSPYTRQVADGMCLAERRYGPAFRVGGSEARTMAGSVEGVPDRAGDGRKRLWR